MRHRNRISHSSEERYAYCNMCRSIAAFESMLLNHGIDLVANGEVIEAILRATQDYRQAIHNHYYAKDDDMDSAAA